MNKRVKGLIASILAGALTASILSPAASAKITGIGYTGISMNLSEGAQFDTFKSAVNAGRIILDDTKVVKVIGKDNKTTDIRYGPKYFSGSNVMDVLQELDGRTDEYSVSVDETHEVRLKDPTIVSSAYFYTVPEHTAKISTFPYDLNDFAKEQGITNDLTEVDGWKLQTCKEQTGLGGDGYVTGQGSEITAQNMLDILDKCNDTFSCVGIEITTKSKTFTFPVYDALFNKTDESISISADTAETEYGCAYQLVYTTPSMAEKVTNSTELWNAINKIYNYNANSSFDPDKAYLVRDCTFNASNINGTSHGDFTSWNLASSYDSNGETYFKDFAHYLWVLSDSSGNFITAAKGEELYGKDTANTALAEYFEKNSSTDKLNLRIFPNVLIKYSIPVPAEGDVISSSSLIRDSKALDHLPVEISELASQITAPAKCRLDCDNWKLFGINLSDNTIYEIEKTGSALDATSVFNGLKSNASSIVVYIPLVCEISDAYLKVTAPALGGTPENVFSFDSDYTVDTSWNTADSAFAADTAYTVTVKLTPKHNYEFTANTVVRINNTDASSVSLGSDGVLTATFEFPKTGKHSISSAALTVEAPVLGGTPANASTADTTYTVATSWNPADSTFAADTAYTMTAVLTPISAYEFTSDTSVTVNGTAAKSVTLGSDGTLTATFEFGKTGKHSISSAALTVEAPVLGGTPANASTDDTSYTVATSWNPADSTFAADTAYTMTAVLTPASGYEFMSGASVTVNGAAAKSVTIGSDGTLTAAFEFGKTGKHSISSAALTVEAPVLGGTPANASTADTSYTVATSWNPADSTFAADTAYTMTAVLTPASGYEFMSGASVTVNGTAAKSVTLGSDGTLTATFEFGKTEKHSISSAALTVEAPVLGGTPANASTADTTYTVATSWNPAHNTFAAETVYTMTAVLTPASGYEFANDTSVTVNGAAASIKPGDDGTLTVYFTFPKTGKKPTSGGSIPMGTGRGNSTRDNSAVEPGTGNSQGWDEIVKEIQSAAVGSEIKITLNDGTVIPAEAVKALAERRIKLIADSGFGRIWTIDCTGLDSGKALDLSTSAVDVRIPEDSYKDIKCGGSVQIKLNAELPGAALSIALRKELAGKNAALYRLNESTGALELLQTSAIDSDGRFVAEITTPGKYFLAYDVEAAEIPAGTAGSGDINGDSVTNALDAALILKAVVGNVELPLSVGDVNGDGVVNALDAQKILADIVGTR